MNSNSKTADWLNKKSITELAISNATVSWLRYEMDNDDKSCPQSSEHLEDELRIEENILWHRRHICKCRLVYDYNRPF